ncbi:hypothetical protein [Lichenibacterium dinghuense]|uniref:hypothetical protein n=1 Tax=Lichenibacterium dinghuense TaxID=2895977 RepID=UPI001F454261|nr:hypothetical protein [Lichenibacterium sp. 6Y81]
MSAYWLPRTRRLAAAGLSLSEIGEAVGRSKVAVWQQLNGVRSSRARSGHKPPARDPEVAKRSRLRAAARAEAAETRDDLAALYRRWGVERLDQSGLWDIRRNAP